MWMSGSFLTAVLALCLLTLAVPVRAQSDPLLASLIEEALRRGPDIQASEAGLDQARLRITQSGALPDPMVMIGYQNDGLDRYTYRREEGSQWMVSVSQQFYFPGKRGLRTDMASSDAQSLEALHELLRLRTIARVTELYYDLFLAYRTLDILSERRDLFSQVENLALARYAAGRGMQSDVLMAQTEKYMLLERETMIRQRLASLEAMLDSALGRSDGSTLPRPNPPERTPFTLDVDTAVQKALKQAPELQARRKMIESARVGHTMAKRELFPDVALGASYFSRGDNLLNPGQGGPFTDMWALTATINIPIYFQWKQKPAIREAQAGVTMAEREAQALALMIAAAVRENLAMVRAADTLLDIYQQGLIPRGRQAIEQAQSEYAAGGVEAVRIVSRMNSLWEYETLYWEKLVERQKAIARLDALMAARLPGGENE